MDTAPLTNLQARLLDAIQFGFPIASDPYAELAAGLDVDTDTLCANVTALRRAGVIRRIGGSFVAAALGYRSTLAAVRVVHDRIETVAARVSVWTEVTHNYERSGKYNLWFAAVARDAERLRRILDDVRSWPGVQSVLELPVIRMFKLRVDFRFCGNNLPGACETRCEGRVPSNAQLPCSPTCRDETDRRLIPRLGGDIGDARRPFHDLARDLDLDEDSLLARLHGYRVSGLMRRFGAILRHQRAGFRANAMGVWDVGDTDVEVLGRVLAGREEVSHCYERARGPDWPFNLYAMIHGRTEAEVRAVAAEAVASNPAIPFRLLFSLREFKKTSLDLNAGGR